MFWLLLCVLAFIVFMVAGHLKAPDGAVHVLTCAWPAPKHRR